MNCGNKYDYIDIVREWFERLKQLCVNSLRKNFEIDYDQAMYIYTNVWLDVRNNIVQGRVCPGTKWSAYILRMCQNQASKYVTRRPPVDLIDDEKFDSYDFVEPADDQDSVYKSPEVKAVLAAELSYIPDPCNKVLKLYYYEGLSMKEIADAMNYSGPRSAITTRKRCFDKLKARVLAAVRRLGTT